ncbi:RHS repeat-associated core domain-containing protein [Salmonella enterica]
MDTTLFSKTPTVTVLDNRALSIREIAWQRHPDSPDTTDERITRNHYDVRGKLAQSADPRLFDAGLVNADYLPDLADNLLRTQSVDTGTAFTLNDAAGRLFLAIRGIGPENDRSQVVTHRWLYEDASLPGRLLAITEQVADEAARVTDRYVYGGNSAAAQDFNLAGQVISQYDTAGLLQTGSRSINGALLSVTRQLLKEADNPDTVVDWQGGDSSAWNDMLDADAYTTLSTVDTTGTVLTTTDATGNVQRVAFDVTGLLKGSWLTLRGGSEQVIVKSLTYSAAGQKLREEHGNGVVTSWRYEPETQRLTEVSTERPAGHAAGAKVLQDLRYEYDPVGNILVITNDAEETRFWRNTEVVPENRYTYDSLYQLVSATGREMANAVQQTSDLPDFTTFDNATYTNYTRNYSYDRAGNLTRVQHSAPASGNNYTTTLTVSDRSNRAVLSTLTENPADVDALFKAGGEQLVLLPGQELVWTPRGELQKVTPVTREGAADDSESYRYDAGSQRTVKVSSQLTGGSTRTQRVVYLPGLELHTTYTGDTESENLQVICVGEAGRAQVRVLHWESGQPADSSNDPLRYSYDNLTGSSVLEVDGSGELISQEEYYPYGGTALFAARSQTEADYKTVRYSGKERDATGLYYYGYRYYQPWAGRWLSADPSGTTDGLNLYRMVRNNPIRFKDEDGLIPGEAEIISQLQQMRIGKDNPKDILDAIKRINPKLEQPHLLVAKYRGASSANTSSKNKENEAAAAYSKGVIEGALYLYSTNAGAYYINTVIRIKKGSKMARPHSTGVVAGARAEFKRSFPEYSFAPGSNMDEVMKALKADPIALMNAAIKSEGYRDVSTYYRGTKHTPVLDAIEPGTVVSANFLMSVTGSKKAASKFASGTYNKDDEGEAVVYEILGKPHAFSKGVLDEDEGLFQVGTRFKFTGIKRDRYQFTELSPKEAKAAEKVYMLFR